MPAAVPVFPVRGPCQPRDGIHGVPVEHIVRLQQQEDRFIAAEDAARRLVEAVGRVILRQQAFDRRVYLQCDGATAHVDQLQDGADGDDGDRREQPA
jgi:hypothetical protein